MIPWWVLKPACVLAEAVINRVSPIQGVREEAWRRTAAFHALEVFEEESECLDAACVRCGRHSPFIDRDSQYCQECLNGPRSSPGTWCMTSSCDSSR